MQKAKQGNPQITPIPQINLRQAACPLSILKAAESAQSADSLLRRHAQVPHQERIDVSRLLDGFPGAAGAVA